MLIDCNQPDLVACYNGQCYTGTLDDRCTNQPNADQPGSPELGDGGGCADGKRVQQCDGVFDIHEIPSDCPELGHVQWEDKCKRKIAKCAKKVRKKPWKRHKCLKKWGTDADGACTNLKTQRKCPTSCGVCG